MDMAAGVVILVADTNGDGFDGPSDTAFVTRDDYLIGKWDIAAHDANAPGTFRGTTGAVSFSGDWDEGDPLALYWFPTLNGASEAPGEAVPYGMFSHGTQDGTDPWSTPEDGTTGHKLIFLTTDAKRLQPGGGSSDSTAGLASNATPGIPPAHSSGVAAEVFPGRVILTWEDESDDETGFLIERSMAESNVWVLAGSVEAGVIMFEDIATTGNAEYLYRIRTVRNASWSGPSPLLRIESGSLPGRWFNLSNRAFIGKGDERLIGSVRAVGEPGAQVEVLAVARGPSLMDDLPADYTGMVLADPKLTLVDLATREETTNDDFADWNYGEIESRFPGFIEDSKESGAILMLETDQVYSAIIEGVGETTGLGQIEFYEVGGSGSITEARLGNLSNRALVGQDEERLIGSAMTTGRSPMEVLVVGRGPSLAHALPDYPGKVLADPRLSLFQIPPHPNGIQISNDNFADWDDGEIESRFPGFIQDSREAGFIVELPAESSFSAVLEGEGGTTGIGQIEFYELSPTSDDPATYGVDDRLPDLPTSGSFSPERTGGGISIMATGEGATISMDDGGFFELTDGTRYTCTAADGCTIVNGIVTAGVIAATTDPGPLGSCYASLLVRMGQSCLYPGTTDVFMVDEHSWGQFLNFQASNGINVTNFTVDGRVYDLAASHQGGGAWRIDRIAGSSEPPPPAKPDLIVSSLSVSDDSPTAGESIVLSATVSNMGDGESDATTLRYYRSTDPTITMSDTMVGTAALGELAALGTSEKSISLPALATPGIYYYGACVDTMADESDATDNCSAAARVDINDPPPPARPDLIVSSLSVSDNSPTTGGSFILSATVRNTGDGDSAATTLRYYRSSNATITTADTQVGTDGVGALAASGSSTESLELTAPSSEGTYYYGACVDEMVDESDTTNNCSKSVLMEVEEPPPPDIDGQPPTEVHLFRGDRIREDADRVSVVVVAWTSGNRAPTESIPLLVWSVGDTAEEGVDFSPFSQSFEFNEADFTFSQTNHRYEAIKYFSITILDDTEEEGDETFGVTMALESARSFVTILSPNYPEQLYITILAND